MIQRNRRHWSLSMGTEISEGLMHQTIQLSKWLCCTSVRLGASPIEESWLPAYLPSPATVGWELKTKQTELRQLRASQQCGRWTQARSKGLLICSQRISHSREIWGGILVYMYAWIYRGSSWRLWFSLLLFLSLNWSTGLTIKTKLWQRWRFFNV